MALGKDGRFHGDLRITVRVMVSEVGSYSDTSIIIEERTTTVVNTANIADNGSVERVAARADETLAEMRDELTRGLNSLQRKAIELEESQDG